MKRWTDFEQVVGVMQEWRKAKVEVFVRAV
jgi:hypothetical protein